MRGKYLADIGRVLSVLVAAALLLSTPGALALVPAVEAQTSEATAAPAAISSSRSEGEDAQIAGRIEGIFSELPALGDVDVSVSEGVVTLSGTVGNAEDKARAEAIATRVSGVVTVENGIERDTSLDGATAGVKRVTTEFAGVLALLPLIGAALLLWLAISGVGYLLAGLGVLWHRLAPNSFLAELIAARSVSCSSSADW